MKCKIECFAVKIIFNLSVFFSLFISDICTLVTFDSPCVKMRIKFHRSNIEMQLIGNIKRAILNYEIRRV